MKLILYLALGGLAGTSARYALQGLVQPGGATFPVGDGQYGRPALYLLGSVGGSLAGFGSTSHVKTEKVLRLSKVIMYRPASVRPSQAELHRIEGLEADD